MPVDLDCTQLNAGIDPAVFAMTIAPGSVAYESEAQTSFVPGGDAKGYAAAAEFAKERLDAARGAGATSLKRCIWPAAIIVVILRAIAYSIVRQRRK